MLWLEESPDLVTSENTLIVYLGGSLMPPLSCGPRRLLLKGHEIKVSRLLSSSSSIKSSELESGHIISTIMINTKSLMMYDRHVKAKSK